MIDFRRTIEVPKTLRLHNSKTLCKSEKLSIKYQNGELNTDEYLEQLAESLKKDTAIFETKH